MIFVKVTDNSKIPSWSNLNDLSTPRKEKRGEAAGHREIEGSAFGHAEFSKAVGHGSDNSLALPCHFWTLWFWGTRGGNQTWGQQSGN